MASPHLRGGDDLGEKWWEDGRALNKQNTFDDFIACAKYLLDNKYCAPHKLVAEGGSAGGLLMGAVANQAPEIFNTIVLNYPFLDMIGVLSQEPTTEYEWGDIKHDPKFYNYVKAYSPFDNIKKQAYPNMLFITSLTDERCYYWESAECVAKLRKNNTADSRLLLVCKSYGGHGGNALFYDDVREDAMWLAQVMYNLKNK